MTAEPSTRADSGSSPLAGIAGIREFSRLVLRPGGPPIQVTRDRIGYWETRTCSGLTAQKSLEWIGNGERAFTPIHSQVGQWAAAVKLPQGQGSAALACFEPAPTFAVVRDDDRTVYAVWLYDRAIRWFAGANLSHAIARRLDARPAARIPVGGSTHWNGHNSTPCRMLTVSAQIYDPDDLQRAVRRQRRRRKDA